MPLKPLKHILSHPAVYACAFLLLLGACSNTPSEPSQPPVLSPIGAKSVLEGEQLQFAVMAAGNGSSSPALSTSVLPGGADFTDHLDGSGTFDWTPGTSQSGHYSVVFRAESEGLFDSELVLIEVTSLPPAPPKDSVILTVDTVLAGDTAVLQLILINPDSAVAGLNVWLEMGGQILYDTAQPLLPRFPVSGMSWITQRHDSVSVMSLLMLDFNPPLDFVAPGSGPLFDLRFAVPSTTAPGVYSVDTTGMFVPRGLDLSYRSGLSVPGVGFVPGQIVVQ